MSRTALRVTAGPDVGKLILVDEELTLGRAEKGDGQALLTRDHVGAWMVRDLGSGPTFLNGIRLAGTEPLHRGDSLRLGSTRMLVTEGASRPPAQRVAPAARRPPLSPPLVSAAVPVDATQPMPAPVEYRPPSIADRIAPTKTRATALVIDSVIATAIVAGSWIALGFSVLASLLGVALVLCWDFLFESLRGQTIGKRIVKIRVARRDGSTLRPQHVAARSVLRLVDGLPGFAPLVGILSVTVSGANRRQRVGDLAAGTIVVKSERAMSKLPAALHDRLILVAYPLLWLAPVIGFGILNPDSALKPCRESDLLGAETTCLAKAPNGQVMRMSIVDAGHTLHWQGYDVRLIASRARSVRRAHGLATVVALRMAVTNRGARKATFDHRSVRMLLNVPTGDGRTRFVTDLSSHLHLHAFPALANSHPLAPGHTRRAWARFAVPSYAVPALSSTLASISFLPAHASGAMRGGNIRLWRTAGVQGARAAHVLND
jgi:uncharacterized RDD family membrane protein YckC